MSLLSEVEENIEKEVLDYQKEVLESYVRDRSRHFESYNKSVENVKKVASMSVDQFKNSSFYKGRR